MSISQQFVMGASSQPGLTEKLCCLICARPVHEPRVHVGCRADDRAFCQDCVSVNPHNQQHCPTCQTVLHAGNTAPAHVLVSQMAAVIRGACVHCKGEFAFGEFAQHLAYDCRIPCVKGCGQLVQPLYPAQLLHFTTTCLRVCVPCANTGCGLLLPRMSMADHVANECEWRRVACSAGKLCNKNRPCLKRNLAAHEAKCEAVKLLQRVDTLTTQHMDLLVKNAALEEEVRVLRQAGQVSSSSSS
jgi:hypothetical protein